MTLLPGTQLGRYEIRSKIGEGGMGEVYLAEDTKLNRKVAVKVLPSHVAEDRNRMNRFVQEAKAASSLNHPNIITIHEIDQTEAGHFIATEFIEGLTLRERLRNAQLDLKEILEISTQISSALSSAHAAGIVHRDKHGLRQDVTTILLSAGGFGVGPVEHLVQALMEMTHPAQVVAICGRNEDLKARIVDLNHRRPRSAKVTIKPIGFTTEMDEYMSTADIIVGKPGGLTTAEALAKGLLLVIVNPIPGQEERNSDHFLEDGVAIRCNNLPVLAYKIDQLLDDRKRLAGMRANVKRIARPNAALDIVKKLLELKKGL